MPTRSRSGTYVTGAAKKRQRAFDVRFSTGVATDLAVVDAVIHQASFRIVDRLTGRISPVEPLATVRSARRISAVRGCVCHGVEPCDNATHVKRQHMVKVEAAIDRRHQERVGARACAVDQAGVAEGAAGSGERSLLQMPPQMDFTYSSRVQQA